MQKVSAVCPVALAGMRFDLLCVELFPELSRKKIKAIIDNGGAYLNKRRLQKAGRLVEAGQLIELCWDGDEKGPSSFVNIDIKELLIYEHQDFLVLNKPAGIPSQATLTSSKNTILHVLSQKNPRQYPLDSLFLVHRLDKETSGVMLVARSKTSQQRLEELFKQRKVFKEYEALCFKAPLQSEGVITYALVADRSRPNTWAPVFHKRLPPGAKSAETFYKVLEWFPKSDASYLLCRPRTGRTHQIRVHLMALGCPILGDKTYAQGILGHSLLQEALRHMLHARRLEFCFKGENFCFEAEYPADFLSLLEKLRKNEK